MLPSSTLNTLERCLERLEPLLPPLPRPLDWRVHMAARWLRRPAGGVLEPVEAVSGVRLEDVLGVDRQKREVVANTDQFVRGYPSNNVLLTGARGAGKSSLVQALLNHFAADGLRLLQVAPQDLQDLPLITRQLTGQPWRFVLFCDDLSFDARDDGYKTLKSLLDGAVETAPENVLIYATSNRRHLMPEFASENAGWRVDEGGELHPGEGSEEKISLSDRFGVWVSFHAMSQEHYLLVARHWLEQWGREHGIAWNDEARASALRWALQRGSRSGRTAHQFARSWVGRRLLELRLAAGNV